MRGEQSHQQQQTMKLPLQDQHCLLQIALHLHAQTNIQLLPLPQNENYRIANGLLLPFLLDRVRKVSKIKRLWISETKTTSAHPPTPHNSMRTRPAHASAFAHVPPTVNFAALVNVARNKSLIFAPKPPSRSKKWNQGRNREKHKGNKREQTQNKGAHCWRHSCCICLCSAMQSGMELGDSSNYVAT